MKIITLQNIPAMAKLTIALFVILPVVGCYEFYMEREGEKAVNSFLEEMSPELAKKITNIEQEISLTEEKINKLSQLKLKHPNYANKIETSRRQWKVLRTQLIQSLKKIRDVVESAYVTYELDQIQGGNQFQRISAQLLTDADSVLSSASVTKDSIEQALNEVSEYQTSPSLNEDISKPIESSKTPNKFETVAKEPTPTVKMTDNVVEKPSIDPKPYLEQQPFSPPNRLSLCDAKNFLAAISLNLTMMVISTDKTEQAALEAKIQEASRNFDRTIAYHQNNIIKINKLRKILAIFKNSCETEIFPAIHAGKNDKASELAALQAENMNTMNDLILDINGDSCE